VVGKPYADPGLPDVTAELTSGLNVARTTSDQIPLPNGVDPASPTSAGDANLFRQWNNFGLIRDVSDHLPIAIDV
jgi:hypothetical protein